MNGKPEQVENNTDNLYVDSLYADVIYPSDAQKEESIRRIVADGLPAPRRLGAALLDTVETLGVRHLFFGVEDCVFLAVVLALPVFGGVCFSAGTGRGMITVLLFVTSPVLYMSLHLLTVWKETLLHTYELLMTCRLSLRQLTVVRMLLFGGASVCVLTISGGIVSWFCVGTASFLRVLSVSFAALFLYAGISLAAEWNRRTTGACLTAPACWLLLTVLLLLLGERAEQWLSQVPVLVFMMIAAGAAALYGRMLHLYYFATAAE